jgi:hypothetical protein
MKDKVIINEKDTLTVVRRILFFYVFALISIATAHKFPDSIRTKYFQFLRNVGIYPQVHTALQPRRPTSTLFHHSFS